MTDYSNLLSDSEDGNTVLDGAISGLGNFVAAVLDWVVLLLLKICTSNGGHQMLGNIFSLMPRPLLSM